MPYSVILVPWRNSMISMISLSLSNPAVWVLAYGIYVIVFLSTLFLYVTFQLLPALKLFTFYVVTFGFTFKTADFLNPRPSLCWLGLANTSHAGKYGSKGLQTNPCPLSYDPVQWGFLTDLRDTTSNPQWSLGWAWKMLLLGDFLFFFPGIPIAASHAGNSWASALLKRQRRECKTWEWTTLTRDKKWSRKTQNIFFQFTNSHLRLPFGTGILLFAVSLRVCEEFLSSHHCYQSWSCSPLQANRLELCWFLSSRDGGALKLPSLFRWLFIVMWWHSKWYGHTSLFAGITVGLRAYNMSESRKTKELP